MTKQKLFLITALLLLITNVFGQIKYTKSPNQSSLTQDVKNDNWGTSFKLPKGYEYKLDGQRYLITSNDENEILIVATHNLKSKQALINDFNNFPSGLDLKPADTKYYDMGPSTIGYELAGYFNKIKVSGFIVCIANSSGKGISVFALVSNGIVDSRRAELAYNIASTVHFFERKINTTSDFPDMQKKVSNKLLYHSDSYSSSSPGGGGYSKEQKISLRNDHTFTYVWRSSIYGPASAIDKDGGDGTWRIGKGNSGGPMLELNFDDGRQKTFDMVAKDGMMYLNNRKHFIQNL